MSDEIKVGLDGQPAVPIEPDGLDEPATRIIQLKSKDGRVFEIDLKEAKVSKLVDTAFYSDQDSSELEVALDGDVLEFIVEYMHHQKGVDMEPPDKPLRHPQMEQCVKDPFHADLVARAYTKGLKMMIDLLMGASYLDIRGLTHLCAAKHAILIKGKTEAEVNEFYKDFGGVPQSGTKRSREDVKMED